MTQCLLFGNDVGYQEMRHYGEDDPMAQFVQNYSEHNVFWSKEPRRILAWRQRTPDRQSSEQNIGFYPTLGRCEGVGSLRLRSQLPQG